LARAFLAIALALKGTQLVATLGQTFSYAHAFVSADVATAARSFLTYGLWTLRFVPINDNPPLGMERAAYLHWPPLTPSLLCVWYKMFGVSEASTHAFSLLVAALMAVALYFLARYTLGELGAVLALLTWACLPVTLDYIHLPSQQNLEVAWFVLALFCATKALEKKARGRFWKIAGLAAVSIAVAASWEAVLLGIGLLAAGALTRRREVRRLAIGYCIASFGVAAAILVLYGVTYPSLVAETLHTVLFRAGLAATYGTERLDVQGVVLQLPFRRLIEFAGAKLLEMLGIVGIIAIGAALWRMNEREKGREQSFGVALIAATVSWVIWYACFLNHVALHPFETMIAVPSVVLATAWCALRAIEYVARQRLSKWWLAALCLVPSLGLVPSALQTYSALYGEPPGSEVAEVASGLEIKQFTPAGSVVLTPDESTILVFYSERHIIRAVSDPGRLMRLLPLVRANFPGAPIYFACTPAQESLFEPMLRNVSRNGHALDWRENDIVVVNLAAASP